ncbi:MAG: hypothetical protein ABIR79_10325, partial [Candidatus Binatia bacterium]
MGKAPRLSAMANAKTLRGKPASAAPCATKHAARLASVSAQARSAVIVCRDGVNGDGTVTDDDTGLQWEQ